MFPFWVEPPVFDPPVFDPPVFDPVEPPVLVPVDPVELPVLEPVEPVGPVVWAVLTTHSP